MKKILFVCSIFASTFAFSANLIKTETNFKKSLIEKKIENYNQQQSNTLIKINDQNCFPVTFTGDQGPITFQWCDSLEKLINEFLKPKPKTVSQNQSNQLT